MNNKRVIFPSWFKSAETPDEPALTGPEVGVDSSVKVETYQPALETLDRAEEQLDAAA